jgi:hypothetical protein
MSNIRRLSPTAETWKEWGEHGCTRHTIAIMREAVAARRAQAKASMLFTKRQTFTAEANAIQDLIDALQKQIGAAVNTERPGMVA